MKFGTLYSYWGNEWSCDYIETAKKVADAGFDILETGAGHLIKMSDVELLELKNLSKDLNLTLTANIGPAKEFDVASADLATRQRGISYLTSIMEAMKKIDSSRIVGVMYTYWPNDFSDLDKEAILARGIESAKILGKVAESLDIEMCMEVVNRFETHILNTAEEGVAFCEAVNNKNVRLLLDTFHMNIEEENIADAIRFAGSYLGQLHVGEGNRNLPGTGSLPWTEIGEALKSIDFKGDIVMEPFLLKGGAVGKDIKVWRDISRGATEAEMSARISESLRFLRKAFE